LYLRIQAYNLLQVITAYKTGQKLKKYLTSYQYFETLLCRTNDHQLTLAIYIMKIHSGYYRVPSEAESFENKAKLKYFESDNDKSIICS
jgi:hypothetical protein